MAGEEASDEQHTDPLIEFKINTYFSTLDITTSVLKIRCFGDDNDNIQQIGIFKDLSLLIKKDWKRSEKANQKFQKMLLK